MADLEALIEQARKQREESLATTTEPISTGPSIPEPTSSVFPELKTTPESPVTSTTSTDLFPELKTEEEPGFIDNATNVVGSVVEGAIKKAGSIFNPVTATTPDIVAEAADFADEDRNFASKVGSGVGGAITQAGVVAGGAATGAAVGSLAGPLGTAVGGAAGATIGAGTVLVQGIRESLFGVRQQTRQEVFKTKGRDATEEELETATDKALPGVITGQTIDTLFAVATGGTGNLAVATAKELAKTPAKQALKEGSKTFAKEGLAESIKAGAKAGVGSISKEGIKRGATVASAKFTQAQRQAAFKAAQSSVSRIGRIGGTLANAAKGAVGEGAGEVIEGVSTRAAAKSVANETGFFEEAGKELTSAETREDFLLGAAVQGVTRGANTVREAKLVGRNDFERGLELIGKKSEIADKSLEVGRIMARLENPDIPGTSVVIPESTLEGFEVEAVFKNEAGFTATNNNDGTYTVELDNPDEVGFKQDERLPGQSLFRKNHEGDPTLPHLHTVTQDGKIDEGLTTYTDKDGNEQTITREDVLAERVTMKLLETSGIDTSNVDLSGPEGSNLRSKANEGELSLGAEHIQFAKENPTKGAIANFVNKNLTQNRGLNPEAAKAKNQADQLVDRYTNDMNFAVKSITSQYKKVANKRFEKGIKSKKRRDDFIKNLDQDVRSVLIGELDIKQVPLEVRPHIEHMRGLVDRASQDFKDRGIVEGDLAAIFDENQGVYLHRSYNKDTDPEHARKIMSDPELRPIYNTAKAFVRTQLTNDWTKNGKKFNNEIDKQTQIDKQTDITMHKLLNKGNHSIMQLLNDSPEAARQLGILQKRNDDLAPEIKALLGEKIGGVESFVTSMTKMSNTIGQHQYYTDLKNVGLREGFVSGRLDESRGLTEFIDPNEADLSGVADNPLAGFWTTPEMKEAITNTPGEEQRSNLMKAYMTLNGFTKYSKTVLNPITHMRNFMSNPLFLMANGNLRAVGSSANRNLAMKSLLTDILTPDQLNTLKEKKGKDTDAWRQTYNKFIELGLVNDSVSAGELHDVMRDGFIGDLTLSKFADKRSSKALSRKAADLLNFEFAARAYQAEDGFWKIVAFQAEKQKYAQAYEGTKTDAELDQLAADVVRNTMPTYSLISDGVKRLKHLPIAPFVSFPAEVLRTQVNTVKLIKSELADPNKKIRAIGKRRLKGLAMAHTLPFLAAKALKMIVGVDDDEEEALRETVAPWDRTGTLMFFGRDSKNRPNYINLSFTDPFSVFKKTLMAGGLASQDGDSMILAGMGEFFEPFISEDLLFERLRDISNNKKKKDGREIFNEQDTESVKMVKKFGYMWEAVEPGFVTTVGRFHEKSDSGKDLSKEGLALLTGLRLSNVDVQKSLPFSSLNFLKEKKDVTRILSTTAKFKEDVTDEQLENKLNRMLDQRERVYKRYNRKVKAALKLGMTEQEVSKVIGSTRAANKKDKVFILGNEVPPFTFTKQFRKAVNKSFPGRMEVLDRALKKREQGVL